MSDKQACEQCIIAEPVKSEEQFRRDYLITAVSTVLFVVAISIEFLWHSLLFAYLGYLAAMVLAGKEIIPRGLRGAAKLHLDINFLMTFAAFAAIIIGAPAEGSLVIILFSIAELLERKANYRVQAELKAVASLRPNEVTVVRDNVQQRVLTQEVKVGEIIAVRPGERIGLDGKIVSGTTQVDEAPITGESLPITKEPGDIVYAGSINLAGYIEVEVTKNSEETILARIIKLVEDARENKSKTESTVARVSHIYTPIVVLASIGLTAISILLGVPTIQAIYRGLSLLVASCPCAFAISIPVSMVSSITGLAKKGMLVKGSRYIETLSKVSIVAFDKTGTLTEGSLRVDEICLHSDASEDSVLTAAAALEQKSEHPIAQAILSAAKERKLDLPPVEKFKVMPGIGISGSIRGEPHQAGNLRLLDTENLRVKFDESHDCGMGSQVYVFQNGEHLGTIMLNDTIRQESKNAISELRKKGIRVVMLTGDNKEMAKQIACDLGIDDVRAELLPEDKVKAIQELSKEGTALMVGDGINDAPALAFADVSIAIGAMSNDVAIESADVALMKGDIALIPKLLDRAKKTMRIIKQNVSAAISIKMFVALLAIVGIAPLWFAIAVGDMGLTFAVVANALRLARK